MERLFVDTSAWLAFVNRRDARHEEARVLLAEWAGRLVTTNFVFDESVTLCCSRLDDRAASLVGEVLRDPKVVELVRVTARDEDRAWQLFLERPHGRYSFTDCTSFVVMRRLGLGTAATLDADFRAEGFGTAPGA